MRKRLKIYLIIFAAAAVSAGVYFLTDNSGNIVTVKSNGEIIKIINLDEVYEPYSMTVEYCGYNRIHVEQGKISVTEADCPDKLCVEQSRNGTFPVVCLPHKLVIEKSK